MFNPFCQNAAGYFCLRVFTAHFLSDGGINVDIGVTAAPVITANYIESYHKVNNTYKILHISSSICIQELLP